MWLSRNKDGKLLLFKYKPYRTIKDTWASYECLGMEIEKELFPDLKWEDEPVKVDIMSSDFLKKLLLDIKSNIRSGKYDGDLWNLFDDLLEICGYQEINSTLTKTTH